MIKRATLLMLIFTYNICLAQNLVPNPGFENYYNCPSGLGQVYQCQNWSTFGRSPDYFNVCATDTNAGVPANYYGSENAATGSAYCDLVTLSAPFISEEYIGAQLIQPLITGQTYYASLKISKCDHSTCSDDKLGICFSTVPFDSLNPPPRNNNAQVYATSIVSQTSGWYLVKGSFVADSNYAYIMIGNFFTNSSSICLPLTYEIHYYVDDICVSTDSLSCYSSVGIDNTEITRGIKISYVPFENKINIIEIPDGIYDFSLIDIAGRRIINQSIKNAESINTGLLPEGVYFYQIRNKNGTGISGKIIM